jgi:hypothetical protein
VHLWPSYGDERTEPVFRPVRVGRLWEVGAPL